MYQLTDQIQTVAGVGQATKTICEQMGIHTVKDIVLTLPLRYEDRSESLTIEEALAKNDPSAFFTLQAEAHQVKEFYKAGRRITSAILRDQSGEIKAYWFNNRFIKTRLNQAEEFFFSGKISAKGILTQPTVEAVKSDTIHTGRLVPIYSSSISIKQGTWRRLLKKVTDSLAQSADNFDTNPTITEAIKQLHFPDSAETLIAARERLALEELLALIKKSKKLQKIWERRTAQLSLQPKLPIIPDTVPFQLTPDQIQATMEIVTDLTHTKPMNRLLVGDVGTGKTIVATLACRQIVLAGQSAALIAPTQILATQHAATIQKIFPELPITVITSQVKKVSLNSQPSLYIGTHSVINRLNQIQPALIVYDEQHRFGVKHRSPTLHLDQITTKTYPHILTMTATPIPRSLMLTIFSHLDLSVIHHPPAGRIPVKTLLVPERKRKDALNWLQTQLFSHPDRPGQALVVCPFIDPSDSEALENVAAVTTTYESLKTAFQSNPQISLGLLHSKLTPTEKERVIKQLFANQIRVLVTTPIVEVGVDIPAADIMVIEAAERFGLASLHQLRGRVGRAGQESFCLLFTNSKQPDSISRLKAFTTEQSGIKLAELDLQKRGAGDIFGTSQHGFSELQFASWTNFTLIERAKKISDQMGEELIEGWQSVLDKQQADTPIHDN